MNTGVDNWASGQTDVGYDLTCCKCQVKTAVPFHRCQYIARKLLSHQICPALYLLKHFFDAAYIKKEAHHLATARLPAIQHEHEHTAQLSITMSHRLVTTGVK